MRKFFLGDGLHLKATIKVQKPELTLHLQCEHCQMQKSIKLLLLDASSLWPGIIFLIKNYV